MALTNERAQLLAQYLADKKEAAVDLVEMDAKEAVAKINADGFDFTAEELHDFAELMEKSEPAGEGELDENALEDVSGGVALGPSLWFIKAVAVICSKAAKRW